MSFDIDLKFWQSNEDILSNLLVNIMSQVISFEGKEKRLGK